MRSLVVAAALIGGLVGCQTAGFPPASEAPPVDRYVLSATETEAVKATVLASLKDPYSAVFGLPFLASRDRRSGAVYVCGKVNAKNSFGGYAGDEWFLGALSTTTGGVALVGIGGSIKDGNSVVVLCNQYVAPAWS